MRLIKKRGKLFRKKDKLKFKTVMPDEIGNAEFNSKMCAFLSDASFGLNFDNEKEPVCIAVKSCLLYTSRCV